MAGTAQQFHVFNPYVNARSLRWRPSYLPLPLQNGVCNNMQKFLEKMVYDFARRRMPWVLELEGWDCPEAVELHNWWSALRHHGIEHVFGRWGVQSIKHLLNRLHHGKYFPLAIDSSTASVDLLLTTASFSPTRGSSPKRNHHPRYYIDGGRRPRSGRPFGG